MCVCVDEEAGVCVGVCMRGFNQHPDTEDLKQCMSCTYQGKVITGRNPDGVFGVRARI